MGNFKRFPQTPFGQVLLATLVFCLIFAALLGGLYKAGSAFLFKERSRRAANLTALTAGAVYANGLQLVRESNLVLMAAASFDAMTIGNAIGAALLAPPPLDIPAVIGAAKLADPHSRNGVQRIQKALFGVGAPTGIYPLLIFSQTAATGSENQLLPPPLYFYNSETATIENACVPNMALRFRTAAEFLPETESPAYSLKHEGIRHAFSPEEVEPAGNPRTPGQMRVKKSAASPFAGWWVRTENSGAERGGESRFLSRIAPWGALKLLRNYLAEIQLDVTDRDDPPCHTFGLFGTFSGGLKRNFYQAGETRIETAGLAAWDLRNPIQVGLVKVDPETLPLLRETLGSLAKIPVLDSILKSSDLLNGL